MPKWRVVLCDLLGRELQVISTAATQKKFSFRLKRPWSFTFRADASDPRLAGLAADGMPYMRKLRRVVKAMRLEGGIYVPKFTGIVWQTHVQADDNSSVAVSCFDVLKRLDRRRVLDVDGFDGLVHFGAGGIKAADTAITDGIQIAKTIVQRTHDLEGFTGIALDPALGAVFEDAPDRAARWERKKVAPALIEIADAFDGFDFRFQPLDRDDGYLWAMQCYAKLGQYRPEVKLAWDLPPHTLQQFEWMDDGETVANDIWAVGGGENGAGQSVAHKILQPSKDAIGAYVDVSAYQSVVVQSLLEDLAQEELNFRGYGKETVTSKPIPPQYDVATRTSISPFPWDDFDLGDVLPVAASSRALGGMLGVQRCWGFDVSVSDEDVELCDAIYTSP